LPWQVGNDRAKAARGDRAARCARSAPALIAKSNERPDMHKIGAFLLAAAAFGFGPAQAQDIAGMEDCTKTSGLDKRTGCFQSNIEYLNRLIAKNTADMQQKLSAANAEIGLLKRAVASLQADIAGLQTNVANLKTSIEQLQQAAKKPDAK
jgi:phage shock protein A